MKLTLPTDSTERKSVPLMSGCIEYFPAALAGVAVHSKIGNDKHNPGQELHHSRGKSNDHADCIVRHLVDIADMKRYLDTVHVLAGSATAPSVTEILAEASALAWRALALSQELHERFGGAPLAPRAREKLEWTSYEDTFPDERRPQSGPVTYFDPSKPIPERVDYAAHWCVAPQALAPGFSFNCDSCNAVRDGQVG